MVVLGVEGQEIAGTELEGIQQFLIGIGVVADDIDLLDGGDLAFRNLDIHRHPVAVLFGDAGFDLHPVFAAAEILAAEFLLDLVQHGPVEDLALGEPDALERLLEVVGADVLVALDHDTGDRRPLLDDDDQRAAVLLKPDILEKPGLEQRLDALRRLPLIEFVAHLDRQITEYRAR